MCVYYLKVLRCVLLEGSKMCVYYWKDLSSILLEGSKAAFTLPQKLARLNRAGLGPDLAHFSGTVYIATKTSSVDPSPVRGARLYVLPFIHFLLNHFKF